jgi:uncharacterized protein with LGFP repeats
MAETITKQLWSTFNGNGFEAESAKYAERASCDAMDNDLTLTITNSKVNAIGGCNLAAETAIKDSEGNLFTTTYAKTADLSNKVDKVEGKGLSENDYTDADKAKVGVIPAAPLDNGHYALACDVVGGVASYRWVLVGIE